MGYIDWPCIQKAVYWAPGSEETGGRDYDDYGKPLFAQAIEIDCRWDDNTEQMVTVDGTLELSRAQVIVDRNVSVRGVLCLGELTDMSDLDNPKSNTGAYEIRRVEKYPDIDGTDTLVRALL